MRKINDYLDAAIERQELGSYRQLARKLEVSNTAVMFWHSEKSLPSPEAMVKLARLAGIDEQVALLELAFMSAPAEGEARGVLEKLIKRLAAFFPATLFGLALFHPEHAQAAVSIGKTVASSALELIPVSVSGMAKIMDIMGNTRSIEIGISRYPANRLNFKDLELQQVAFQYRCCGFRI